MLRRLLLILVVALTANGLQAQTDRQYVRNGNKYFMGGYLELADMEYRKALSVNENNTQALYNRGCVYIVANPDTAIQFFTKAGMSETNKIRKAMAYHNIGWVYHYHQRYDEAIEAYKEALRNNPDDNDTRYNLQLALWKKKHRQDEAVPEDKPYAVFDGKTLMFFYDNNYDSRQGVVFDLNTYKNEPAWRPYASKVSSVVFDDSFFNAWPNSCYHWFAGMSKMTTIEGFQNLRTDEVVYMNGMFEGCDSLKSLDISHFFFDNLGIVNRESDGMLSGCSSLESLNVPASANNMASNACDGVGKQSSPCILFYPEGFKPAKGKSSKEWFVWKKGYFTEPDKSQNKNQNKDNNKEKQDQKKEKSDAQNPYRNLQEQQEQNQKKQGQDQENDSTQNSQSKQKQENDSAQNNQGKKSNSSQQNEGESQDKAQSKKSNPSQQTEEESQDKLQSKVRGQGQGQDNGQRQDNGQGQGKTVSGTRRFGQQISDDNAERLLDAATQQEKRTQGRINKAMQQPRRKNLQKNW